MRQFLLSVWGTAGDTSIQQANEKRFQERVQQLFKQFKEQRLTNAALECEQLINRGTQQLTEVCVYKCMFASSTSSAALQQKQMTVFFLPVLCACPPQCTTQDQHGT